MLDNLQTYECAKCRMQKTDADFYWRSSKRVPRCKACYSDYYRERKASGKYRGVVHMEHEVIRSCQVCGQTFSTGRLRRAYCSRVCKETARYAAFQQTRDAAKPERACLHCGSVLSLTMRIDAVYCSAQCNSSAHGSKRANGRLTRGSGRRRDIQRAYVIARDKSRCHLCGKQCEVDDIHLDHLVPLSLGGTHDESNLRVACVRCNTSKRHTPANEQLMLVG